MPTTLSWWFVTLAALLVLISLVAVVAIGQLRLGTSTGLERDGMVAGAIAPRWELTTLDGTPLSSPHPRNWQLLLFADHCLMEFPGVVAGVNTVQAAWPQLEIVVLARRGSAAGLSMLPLLGLSVPTIAVDPALYHRYNVRVMPFVIIVSPAGTVAASSLINHDWQVETLWRNARARHASAAGRQP